jgi:hypothetical protein
VHDALRTCATLLVDLDVHPRVIMRVVLYADVGVTMEVYANACARSTREALRRLGSHGMIRPTAVLCCCTDWSEALTRFGASL